MSNRKNTEIKLEGVGKFQKMLAFIQEINEKHVKGMSDDDSREVTNWLMEIEKELLRLDTLQNDFNNLKEEHFTLIDLCSAPILKSFSKTKYGK